MKLYLCFLTTAQSHKDPQAIAPLVLIRRNPLICSLTRTVDFDTFDLV